MRFLIRVLIVVCFVTMCASAFCQPTSGEEGEYSISFDKADIQSVVKFMSVISGVPIVVDPGLKGDVTVICSRKLTLTEAFGIVEAALRVHGYTMVGSLDSSVIRVMPIKKAVSDSTIVGMGKDLPEGISDQEMITQVVPIEYASSDTLRDQMKTIVSSDEASMVSIASTNTLVITDNVGNVRRLLEIIKNLDKDLLGNLTVEVYQCKYASADSIVKVLNDIFQPSKATSAQTTNQNRGGRTQPQPNQPNQPGTTPSTDTGIEGMIGNIAFSSDARSNSIIISATKERISKVIELVEKLDVDTEAEVKVKCFPLKYADADTVANQLNSIFEQPQGGSTSGQSSRMAFFGGGRSSTTTTTDATGFAGLKRNVVVADVRTNSVIVTASDQNMKSFENVIEQLDTPRVLSEVTRVYPLQYARSDDLASTLTSLFRGNTTSTGRGFWSMIMSSSSSTSDSPLSQLQNITVVSEPKTNSLLVTGPPNAMGLLDKFIPQLDKRTPQVFIEVAIVDVTLDKGSKFGVEWEWSDSSTPNVQTGNTAFGLSEEKTGLKYSILNNNVSALLHALQTRDDVKVLSTPSITTADNVEAKISVGEDRPYVSSSTVTSGGNQVNSVEFKTVAVSLTVTPHVNEASDVVALEIQQLINEVIGTEEIMGAPIVAAREATTSVTVRDGQTIVIGGIIKESKTRTIKGVPLLSSIPLIGEVFKSRVNETRRTELMVFLTPHILKGEEGVDSVTDSAKKSLSIEPPVGAVAGNNGASGNGSEEK